MRILIFIVLLPALASCANPINLRTAENYYVSGQTAEISKDYVLARRDYSRALLNAQLGKAQPSAISMLTYNLGRMTGYVCEYLEAEKLLLDALTQEEKITGPESGITSMRLLELARLNFDQKRFAQSIPYFQRGVANVEKLNIERDDPIGFALVLDDYATALVEAGQATESASIRARADELRRKNQGRNPGFVPIRYNQPCPPK